MGKAHTVEKIHLNNVILSFPVLDKPRAFKEGQEPKFEATFLLDPTNAEHAKTIAAIKSESARIAKLTFDGTIPKSLERCWGTEADLDKVYDGYEGKFWIKAKNAARVPVVNRRKQPVVSGDPQWPYPGCTVNASVTVWSQDSHGRKGINGNLLAIQFVADGQAFGKAPINPDDEFESLEGETVAAGPDVGDGWDN